MTKHIIMENQEDIAAEIAKCMNGKRDAKNLKKSYQTVLKKGHSSFMCYNDDRKICIKAQLGKNKNDVEVMMDHGNGYDDIIDIDYRDLEDVLIMLADGKMAFGASN